MPKDRSVRMLVAALFFVLALFLGMSYLVESRSLLDWWLPLGLFIVGLAALLLDRSGATADQTSDVALTTGAQTYTVREYTFPDRAAGAVDESPESEEKTYAERAMDDVVEAGEFAPPTSAEGALNPPTESDSVAGAVVQQRTPVQTEDKARPEMPLEPHEVEKPEQTQAERLDEKGDLLQPADTAENEFQSGEHVAGNQPTQSAPPPTVTTGEGAGEGQEPLEPEEKEVLDTQAAPPQPTDNKTVDPTQPDVADAVLNDEEDEATTEGIAPSDRIEAGSGKPDDLTPILGIGRQMQAALRAAGYDTYTKLAGASEDELRAAIEAAGMRLAPTLSTWPEQAGFLARGDRDGFEALKNAMRSDANEDDDQ